MTGRLAFLAFCAWLLYLLAPPPEPLPYVIQFERTP